MTTTVRTTTLEVWIGPAPTVAVPDPALVLDVASYAVSCSFGFDQRFAECTIRRTGGGTVEVQYWSTVEVKLGCTPGAGLATRFKGYVIPIDNALFPLDNVLVCKGYLYRADWVRNQQAGGTDYTLPAGASDEAIVQAVLTACGVPYTASNIGGTGKTLGTTWVNWDDNDSLTRSPFTWAEGESGLAIIERLDEVSVPDPVAPATVPAGRYRTFESLNGEIYRIALSSAPATTPDFSFTEGEDVLEARITRDPTGAANRVVVIGAPLDLPDIPTVVHAQTYTASTPTAPYLPPGLPNGPEGYPSLAISVSSPLLEKSLLADTGDMLSCEALAKFLLGDVNSVVDTLEFSTPRDDLLGPGQTIHLHSPRLGITDEDQHYWLQRLEITFDERGAFTQRLTCLRKS